MKHLKKGLSCSAVLMLVFALYLGADYFNLPSKMGISVENLNLDLLSIVVGNAVVIIIAAITFILIDARSIEKDRLAKYAAASLLSEAYGQIWSTLMIIKTIFLPGIENENYKISHTQIEFLENCILKYDEAIFDNLNNGNILVPYYEEYLDVKILFKGITAALESGTDSIHAANACRELLKMIDPKVDKAKKNIKKYMESLKLKLDIKSESKSRQNKKGD